MMQIIWHQSSLRTARECEKKFDYRYKQGLKPAEGSHAMERGSWVHFALAIHNLRKGLREGTLLHVPDTLDPRIEALGEVTLNHRAEEFEIRGNSGWIYTMSPAGVVQCLSDLESLIEDDDYEPLADEVQSLLQRYFHNYRGEDYEVLAVEHDWQRKDELTGVTYSGAVDLIKRQNGMVVVTDHKTHASEPDALYRLTDSQLHLYGWGVAEWLFTEHELKVDAVEFDYLITRKPVEIKWTKPTKTKPSRLYATVLKSDAVDYVSLKQAIREKEATGEEFEKEQAEEFLAKVKEKGSPFFSRSLMPISSHVIGMLLEEHAFTALRGFEVLTGQRLPTRSVNMMKCRRCPFRDVCAGDLYGNDTTLLKDDFIEGDIHTTEGTIACKDLPEFHGSRKVKA